MFELGAMFAPVVFIDKSIKKEWYRWLVMNLSRREPPATTTTSGVHGVISSGECGGHPWG
jgi:hypothetical protein